MPAEVQLPQEEREAGWEIKNQRREEENRILFQGDEPVPV